MPINHQIVVSPERLRHFAVNGAKPYHIHTWDAAGHYKSYDCGQTAEEALAMARACIDAPDAQPFLISDHEGEVLWSDVGGFAKPLDISKPTYWLARLKAEHQRAADGRANRTEEPARSSEYPDSPAVIGQMHTSACIIVMAEALTTAGLEEVADFLADQAQRELARLYEYAEGLLIRDSDAAADGDSERIARLQTVIEAITGNIAALRSMRESLDRAARPSVTRRAPTPSK